MAYINISGMVAIPLNIARQSLIPTMEATVQLDSARTVHLVRNIVGRVTYGLVGLDKLLQGKKDEADLYLESFLSLFQPSNEIAQSEHRLLPKVGDTLELYNPKLTEGLQVAASHIKEMRSGTSSIQEIKKAYEELERLLDMIYDATGIRPKLNPR